MIRLLIKCFTLFHAVGTAVMHRSLRNLDVRVRGTSRALDVQGKTSLETCRRRRHLQQQQLVSFQLERQRPAFCAGKAVGSFSDIRRLRISSSSFYLRMRCSNFSTVESNFSAGVSSRPLDP